MNHIEEIPVCCRQCHHFDFEMTSEDYGHPVYYCKLNLFFPTKKKACKRAEAMKLFEVVE